jgi:hypothetical protein
VLLLSVLLSYTVYLLFYEALFYVRSKKSLSRHLYVSLVCDIEMQAVTRSVEHDTASSCRRYQLFLYIVVLRRMPSTVESVSDKSVHCPYYSSFHIAISVAHAVVRYCITCMLVDQLA